MRALTVCVALLCAVTLAFGAPSKGAPNEDYVYLTISAEVQAASQGATAKPPRIPMARR